MNTFKGTAVAGGWKRFCSGAKCDVCGVTALWRQWMGSDSASLYRCDEHVPRARPNDKSSYDKAMRWLVDHPTPPGGSYEAAAVSLATLLDATEKVPELLLGDLTRIEKRVMAAKVKLKGALERLEIPGLDQRHGARDDIEDALRFLSKDER